MMNLNLMKLTMPRPFRMSRIKGSSKFIIWKGKRKSCHKPKKMQLLTKNCEMGKETWAKRFG